jgi:hypothetical protein
MRGHGRHCHHVPMRGHGRHRRYVPTHRHGRCHRHVRLHDRGRCRCHVRQYGLGQCRCRRCARAHGHDRWHHDRWHRGWRHRRGLPRYRGAATLPPPRFHLPGWPHWPPASRQSRPHHSRQLHSKKRGGRLHRKRPPTKFVRRRPTLPRGPPRSTIGAEGLNFRVRNGTGCFPFAMTTETLWRCGARPHLGNRTVDACTRVWELPPRPGSCRSQASRPISTGQLHVLPRFHFRPINPVV